MSMGKAYIESVRKIFTRRGFTPEGQAHLGPVMSKKAFLKMLVETPLRKPRSPPVNLDMEMVNLRLGALNGDAVEAE